MNDEILKYQEGQQTKVHKIQFTARTFKLDFGKEEFQSRSNEELESYKFGVFEDNALTFMI